MNVRCIDVSLFTSVICNGTLRTQMSMYIAITSPREVERLKVFLLRVPEDKAKHLMDSGPDIKHKFPYFKHLELHNGKAPIFEKKGTILMNIFFQDSPVGWTKVKRVQLRKYLSWICHVRLDRIKIVWTLPTIHGHHHQQHDDNNSQRLSLTFSSSTEVINS